MRKLTYNDGQFVLVEKDTKTVFTDFKAAARFRRIADKRALRILDRAFVKHFPVPSAPLPLFLDPHQKEGVLWVLTRSRSYLAHAPGAGKTCEAITAAVLAGKDGHGGNVVFIVPPSLTLNWARETARFYALLNGPKAWPSISIIPESNRQEFAGWGAEFVIVPDSMLTRPWVLENLVKTRKRLIAVDEASRFKEPGSQRTIALFGGILKDGTRSPGLVHGARHSVLLDGSPMPNRPMELWAPTYAMSPESIDFMSREDFGFRYCGAKINRFGRWEFKHESRPDELREKLQASFMHVVPESELSHPERKRAMLFMSCDPRSPEHKGWERRNLTKINFSDVSEDMNQGDMARFRAELGMRKVPWTVEYVKERLQKGEAVLVFAWHREVCFELEHRLRQFKPGLVIGGTDPIERENSFRRFQTGASNLIILNIAAGGRGHNLQRADRVVFCEFSWTDELNKQCEKRASRRGNEKAYTRCDYVVAPNSMDEPVLNAVFKKAERVKRIIG